jgi:hypothetical protein
MINAPDLSTSYCRHDNIAEVFMLLNTASAAALICPVTWEIV